MRIKGSTLIIIFMYVSWIAFLPFMVFVKLITGSFLPDSVVYGTSALFIVETVSLARLKMAKEGSPVPAQKTNSFLARMGLTGITDFEEDVQTENAKHAKEASNGLEK